MNLKHYDKDFQNEAMKWWRTLSINQQKEYEKAHGIIYNMALRSEVAAIYDKLSLDIMKQILRLIPL